MHIHKCTWWSVMVEKLHFASIKRSVTFRSKWDFGGVISYNRNYPDNSGVVGLFVVWLVDDA